MKLTIEQTNELKTYLKDKTYSPFHRRLQVILFRAEGLSYKEITNLIDYSKYTHLKQEQDKKHLRKVLPNCDTFLEALLSCSCFN